MDSLNVQKKPGDRETENTGSRIEGAAQSFGKLLKIKRLPQRSAAPLCMQGCTEGK
jgi:hypothetical protein